MISYPSKGGKQCPWIAIRLQALLVEGIPQAPMNAEFYSAAARPMDAFDHDQFTAGRGLFLFWHPRSTLYTAQTPAHCAQCIFAVLPQDAFSL